MAARGNVVTLPRFRFLAYYQIPPAFLEENVMIDPDDSATSSGNLFFGRGFIFFS